MLNLTPILRLYARKRLSTLTRQDYANVQEQQLLRLVHRAQDTQFGRDHNFSEIRSVQDFQRKVPLRTYEAFWDDYWKRPFPTLTNCSWPGTVTQFAVSSGTSSGTTKYLPCTDEILQSNTKAGLDLLSYHLSNRPKSRPKSAIFGGKSFVLGGSTDLKEEAPGIYSGDLSGITTMKLPFWAKGRYFPNANLALVSDWEKKIDMLARQSLTEDIRMLSGVPSWLLILIDKLGEITGKRDVPLTEYFPNLEMLVHGGVNFAPYYEQFSALCGHGRVELREVYPASEGFIAVADRGYGEGLRVSLDHHIFYEFIPLDELESDSPPRYWIKDVECGVNYAIALSTCAGLWSYVLGDTVRFVELDPPRLLITGRTSYYLSAFGEHLIAEEIEYAVSTAAQKIGVRVLDYSVGPKFPSSPGELGGHVFIVEFGGKQSTSGAEIEQFAQVVDECLCARNEDYEAHRAKGYGLKPPDVRIVPEGCFAAWMKSRGKLGGQHKVPRIINDSELLYNLLHFSESYER